MNVPIQDEFVAGTAFAARDAALIKRIFTDNLALEILLSLALNLFVIRVKNIC